MHTTVPCQTRALQAGSISVVKGAHKIKGIVRLKPYPEQPCHQFQTGFHHRLKRVLGEEQLPTEHTLSIQAKQITWQNAYEDLAFSKKGFIHDVRYNAGFACETPVL